MLNIYEYLLPYKSDLQGVVTSFVLKTYPQGQVWVRLVLIFSLLKVLLGCSNMQGGTITYVSTSFSALSAATAAFSQNNVDPKAALITTYNAIAGLVRLAVILRITEAKCYTDSLKHPLFSSTTHQILLLLFLPISQRSQRQQPILKHVLSFHLCKLHRRTQQKICVVASIQYLYRPSHDHCWIKL